MAIYFISLIFTVPSGQRNTVDTDSREQINYTNEYISHKINKLYLDFVKLVFTEMSNSCVWIFNGRTAQNGGDTTHTQATG